MVAMLTTRGVDSFLRQGVRGLDAAPTVTPQAKMVPSAPRRMTSPRPSVRGRAADGHAGVRPLHSEIDGAVDGERRLDRRGQLLGPEGSMTVMFGSARIKAMSSIA